jgi:hypothetical protein
MMICYGFGRIDGYNAPAAFWQEPALGQECLDLPRHRPLGDESIIWVVEITGDGLMGPS